MDQPNQEPREQENQEKKIASEENAPSTQSQGEQDTKKSSPQSYYTEQAFTGRKFAAEGSASFSKADNTKLFSILAYFSILWLLGLLIDPDNPKVKFHVNQGILLSVFSAAFSLMITILNAAFTYLPFMFIFTTLLSVLGGIVVFALMILGIINVAQDKEEPLPVLGSLYTFIN